MSKTSKHELIVVGGTLIIFLLLLYPSLRHARREARDEIRRTEVAGRKVELEQYFNKHHTYPLKFDAHPHRYVVTEQDEGGAAAWYLQAQLELPHESLHDYDAEAGRNYYYRYQNRNGRTFYEVCGGTPKCDLPN